jgi:hypothetical protein
MSFPLNLVPAFPLHTINQDVLVTTFLSFAGMESRFGIKSDTGNIKPLAQGMIRHRFQNGGGQLIRSLPRKSFFLLYHN